MVYMENFEFPLYIEIKNGQVQAIWYTDSYGQDGLLNEGQDYHLEYALTECEGCANRFPENELRICQPGGQQLCAKCAEQNK